MGWGVAGGPPVRWLLIVYFICAIFAGIYCLILATFHIVALWFVRAHRIAVRCGCHARICAMRYALCHRHRAACAHKDRRTAPGRHIHHTATETDGTQSPVTRPGGDFIYICADHKYETAHFTFVMSRCTRYWASDVAAFRAASAGASKAASCLWPSSLRWC